MMLVLYLILCMVFFICSRSHMIYFCFLHQWLGWEFAEGLAEVSWDSRDQVDHNQVLAGVYEEQRLQRVLDVVEEPQGFYWAVIVTFTCWIKGSRIATQFKRINKLGIVDWNQWTSVEIETNKQVRNSRLKSMNQCWDIFDHLSPLLALI